MADTLSTAVFRAIADFSGLDRSSQKSKRLLKEVDDQASSTFGTKMQTSLKNRSRQMRQFGRDTSYRAGVPLAALGAVAVNTFADFEASITMANQKAGGFTKNLDLMKKAALDVGKQTSFSAREAAEGLNELTALGFSAAESISSLDGVVLAAQASQSDLALTSRVVGQSMKAFNIPAKESGHVADVLAQASNTSAINMEGLADALAHAGQLGPAANQSLEDVVASVSRLVDLGVPAASAGASVRQMIQSLKAPRSMANGVLKTLGIQVRDANGDLLPMPEILRRVQKGFSNANPKFKAFAESGGEASQEMIAWADAAGLSEKQLGIFIDRMKVGGKEAMDYAASVAFGVEGGQAFSLLTKKSTPLMIDISKEWRKMSSLQKGLAETMGTKGAKAWIKNRTEAGKFKATGADIVEALSAMNKGSDGTAKRMGRAFQKTTKQKIDNMQGSIETLAITLITELQPYLNKVVDTITKWVSWLSEAVTEHPKLTAVVLGLVAALMLLGPVVWVLGAIGGAFSTLFGVIGGGVKGVKKFAGWMKNVGNGSNKTGRALTTARLRMWQLRDATVRGTKAMGSWIKTSAKNGGRRLAWMWGSLQAKMSSLRAAIVRGAAALKAWVVQTAKSIAAGVRQAAIWTAQKAKMVAYWIAQRAVTAASKAAAAAQWLLNAALMANPIGLIILAVIALVAGFVLMYRKVGWFKAGIDAIFSGIASAVSWVVGFIRKHWKTLGTIFLLALGPIGWVVLAIIKNFDKLKKGVGKVKAAFSAAVDAIGSAWEKIQGKISGPVKWVIDTVINKGLIDGINWLLGKLGIGKKIPHVPGVASGPGLSGKSGAADRKKSGGQTYHTGGYTGRGGKYEPAGEVHRDEFVVRKFARRRIERQRPGILDHMNTYGEIPGYAKGGRVYPVKGSKKWTTYPGHTGVDFPRGMGTPVYAAHTGRISRTPVLAGSYGRHIWQSGSGGSSIYAHLSETLAKVGQIVSAGEQIGKVGSTGNSTGPHLHFERRPPGTSAGTGAWLRGAGTPSGKKGGFGFNPISWAKKRLNALKDKAASIGHIGGSMAQGATKFAGSSFMEAVKRFAKGVAKKGLEWSPPGLAYKGGKAAVKGVGKIAGALFDNGGLIPPGTSLVHNKTGKPEAVLTSPQWSKLMSSMEANRIPPEVASFINSRAKAGNEAASSLSATFNSPTYTWHVYNPVAEKTSATTLKTLTKKAHGGLNG